MNQKIKLWISLLMLVILLLFAGCSMESFFTAVDPNASQPTQQEESKEPEESKPDAGQVESLLQITDQLAAQYDYEKAIAQIEAVANWDKDPSLQQAHSTYQQAQSQTTRYADPTTIGHIFFHSLIADTARAFDGDSDAVGYNLYMTTTGEFEKILQQLYDKGYVLVNLHDIAQMEPQPDGSQKMVQGNIMLPPGKTPLVMSQDDLNYYTYMTDGNDDGLADQYADGFATKIVVGDDGKPTCSYITADGKTVTGEYDLVPILDAFLQKHPDFSYRGAKATLGVTGYEGVLGYRTHPKYEAVLGQEAYAGEVEQAKAAAQCLKDDGYVIASHSFGHPAYGQISADRVSEDVQKWEKQVEPIVGETDILIYPYGNDIAGVEAYSGAKFDTLYQAGYRYFCNVDASAPYWVQVHDGYVRQARINLDGYRLTHRTELISHLIDPASVLDPARPLPVPDM